METQFRRRADNRFQLFRIRTRCLDEQTVLALPRDQRLRRTKLVNPAAHDLNALRNRLVVNTLERNLVHAGFNRRAIRLDV